MSAIQLISQEYIQAEKTATDSDHSGEDYPAHVVDKEELDQYWMSANLFEKYVSKQDYYDNRHIITVDMNKVDLL